MTIKEDLLTVNPFSRPKRILHEIAGIVIHWVNNPGTTAKQNRDYFESLKNQKTDLTSRYASIHFIIGLDGEIIQCLPINEMAFHVGALKYTQKAIQILGPYPNNNTIGIELCHPDSTGKFNEATLESAIKLSAKLIKEHYLNPEKDIWTHYEITEKICPKYFIDHPETFEQFKLDVNIEIGNSLKEIK